MNRTLTKLLSDIETPGTFATRMRASADGLEIDVTGVGPLKFPITPRLARRCGDDTGNPQVGSLHA